MADDSTKTEARELSKEILAPADGPRENLVVTAVKFLLNPKVKNSPLSQKKAFLESKGLTSEEIQLAVQRAGVTDDVSSPPQTAPLPQLPSYANSALVPSHQLLPSPPISPWSRFRDAATTAAIVAAVSYTVYNLFKMYVRPWLTGKLDSESRLERLEASIVQLQASIAESNAQIVETLKAVQESLELQRDRSLQNTEVNTHQQSHALKEVKSEISSLKGLLLNRRQFPPPPSVSPKLPAWQSSKVRDDESQPPSLTGSEVSQVTETANGLHDDTASVTDAGEVTGKSDDFSCDTASTNQSSPQTVASISEMSTNSAFELVRETSDPDLAAEVD